METIMETTMEPTLVDDIVAELGALGIPPDFGPGRSQLLLRVLERLGCGRPVTEGQVHGMIADLDISQDEAEEFLDGFCERDAGGRIIGCMGLSLSGRWPHRFYVNGTALRAWCAWDTLFLPTLLNRTASIVSFSPASKKEVRVTVSPVQVEWTCPNTAVVSIVNLNLADRDTCSVKSIWSTFCQQVYFFHTQQDAEEWAADKEYISILPVEEAYELGKRYFSKLLSYA